MPAVTSPICMTAIVAVVVETALAATSGGFGLDVRQLSDFSLRLHEPRDCQGLTNKDSQRGYSMF